MKWYGWAFLATTLYGISIPLNKILLAHITPFYLIAFSNLGAIVVLGVYLVMSKYQEAERRASFDRQSFFWLMGSLICGGVLGPFCAILGLERASATVSSLLFNLEIILTAFLAWAFFRERLTRTVWLAAMAVFLGGILTTWEAGKIEGTLLGIGLILLSTLFWSVDSNFLRRVEHMRYAAIVFLQSVVACVGGFIAGAVFQSALPTPFYFLMGMLLGATCYAASGVIYIIVLKERGAARTSAFFGVAPFIGAIASILFLKEPLLWQILLGMILMALGVGLLLYEKRGKI